MMTEKRSQMILWIEWNMNTKYVRMEIQSNINQEINTAKLEFMPDK
jgi:hypothetical protein